MAAIRSKDTRPELIVRRFLFACGFRYRLNSPRLPGHPDLVLRKYRTCIFINGCFWHGHDCPTFHLPKTNTAFWQAKIERNRTRDKEEQRALARMGWHCITVWECQLRPAVREHTLREIEYLINHTYLQRYRRRPSTQPRPYGTPPAAEAAMPMAAEPSTPYGKPQQKEPKQTETTD